jgi:predicted RNA-binding Zn ribbon-like protein
LETVRDFVNTLEVEQSTDPLAENGSLAAWCAQTRLCPDVTEEALADLRAFREALRGMLEANAGDAEAAERRRALEPFAARAGFRMCISESGVPALRPQGDGADFAIASLLRIVYDAMAQGTWPRLKACRKHSCRWAFYDKSKNGSGAWCSMQVCGNRVKAQRRRAREKSHAKR